MSDLPVVEAEANVDRTAQCVGEVGETAVEARCRLGEGRDHELASVNTLIRVALGFVECNGTDGFR